MKVDSTVFANQIRYYIIDMIRELKAGHIGGSLSMTDLLAVLYGEFLKIRPEQPDWPDRDYFVLSKGHGGPALYATLSLKGYFDKSVLYTLNRLGTSLPSHPDRLKTPGVDATTGCLGQGLSVAAGIALGFKTRGSNQKVFCLVGDGELNEGQNYEAMQSIAHHNLHNLITIVDSNEYQLDGATEDICSPKSYAEKFKSFGFRAEEIDGHDHAKIRSVLEMATASDNHTPVAIIAHTVKGKGLECAEKNHSHYDKLDNNLTQEYVEGLKKYKKSVELL